MPLAGPEFYHSEPIIPDWDPSKFKWHSPEEKPIPGHTKEILCDDGLQLFTLENDDTPFHYRVDYWEIERWAYLIPPWLF